MDSALDTMPVQEPATIIEAELPAGEVEERRHFRAYMSPETAAKIPYAGELAESMRRNLVIVSKADIFTPDGRPVIPDMPKIIWGGLTGASPDWSVNLADALGFPDVPGSWKMAAPQFDGVVSDAFNQRASSRPVDYNGDGVVDFGVITTQDLDMSPEGHLGYIAGLSSGAVTDAPGDAFCYSAFFFAHEARHVAQDPARFEANYPHIPLPFEIDADQGAHNFILGGGISTEHDCTEPARALRHARLAGSIAGPGSLASLGEAVKKFARGRSPHPFSNAFPTHATHFATAARNLPERGFPLSTDIDRTEFFAMMRVKTLVNGLVGTVGLARLAMDAGGYRAGGRSSFAREVARAFSNPQDPGAALSSPEVARLGAMYTGGNPVIALAALSVLEETGYIRAGTPEAEYTGQVRDFYRKHAPGILQSPEFHAFRRQMEPDFPQGRRGWLPSGNNILSISPFRP